MVIDNYIKIIWNKRNKKDLIISGYKFTRYGDGILVDINHISRGSKIRINILCDYCGETFQREIKTYYSCKEKSVIEKDCCYKCQPKKNKESLLLKYGVNNVSKINEIKIKKENSSVRKYGVINVSQSSEVKEKKIEASIKKFGTLHVLQSPKVMAKIKETNINKYGVSNPMQDKHIKIKAMRTMYTNSNAPCSKQQIFLHKILGGVLNYPIHSYFLDIAFPDEKVYIEYDGGGHNLSVKKGTLSPEEFMKKEIIRNNILKRKGWKIIRIKSARDQLPEKNVIIDLFYTALTYIKNGRSWVELNIDESKIFCNNYHTYVDLGLLKKVN